MDSPHEGLTIRR